MPILLEPTKQPDDEQDYDMDFTAYIESMGESVDDAHTVDVEVSTGLTLGTGLKASSISSGVAKAWVSGGTTATKYTITYTLHTAGGRIHQQEIKLAVKETS